MKKSFVLVFIATAALWAQNGPRRKAQADDQEAASKKAPVKAKPIPASNAEPLKLPADAKPSGKFMWIYTDPKGVRWTYRETPFGLVRFVDTEKAGDSKIDAFVNVIDQGETFKFVRASPFGDFSWEKKKSELNDDEIEFVKHAESKSTAEKK